MLRIRNEIAVKLHNQILFYFIFKHIFFFKYAYSDTCMFHYFKFSFLIFHLIFVCLFVCSNRMFVLCQYVEQSIFNSWVLKEFPIDSIIIISCLFLFEWEKNNEIWTLFGEYNAFLKFEIERGKISFNRYELAYWRKIFCVALKLTITNEIYSDIF